MKRLPYRLFHNINAISRNCFILLVILYVWKIKHEKIYKEVEIICKKERIMENFYGVVKFNDGEFYFTTSQETEVKEMVSEGLDVK